MLFPGFLYGQSSNADPYRPPVMFQLETPCQWGQDSSAGEAGDHILQGIRDSFWQFIWMNPLSWELKGTFERTTLVPQSVLKSLTNCHRWNVMLEQKEVSKPQITPFRVFEERTVERCWEGGRDAPSLYSTAPTSQLWKQHSWACFQAHGYQRLCPIPHSVVGS